MPASDNSVENNDYIIENENISIDIRILYAVSFNDAAFVTSTIKIFLKNMPGTLDNLQQSSDRHNWEDVYKYAHSAKSSLSVIKIADLYNLIREIELSAKDKVGLAGIPALILKTREKYTFAKNLLNERFKA